MYRYLCELHLQSEESLLKVEQSRKRMPSDASSVDSRARSAISRRIMASASDDVVGEVRRESDRFPDENSQTARFEISRESNGRGGR